MYRPFVRRFARLDRVCPLNESALFALVNLLTASNEADDNAPVGNAFCKVDEVFRLGFPDFGQPVLFRDHRRVVRALSLVEYKHVFGWYETRRALVTGYIILHASDERAPASACLSKLVLKNFNQRAVTWEKDSRDGRSAASSGYCQVVDEMRVNKPQSDKCLAGSRHTRYQRQPACLGSSAIVNDLRQCLDSVVSNASGSLDTPKSACGEQLPRSAHQRWKWAISIRRQEFASINE
jgi:hypothetical protein